VRAAEVAELSALLMVMGVSPGTPRRAAVASELRAEVRVSTRAGDTPDVERVFEGVEDADARLRGVPPAARSKELVDTTEDTVERREEVIASGMAPEELELAAASIAAVATVERAVSCAAGERLREERTVEVPLVGAAGETRNDREEAVVANWPSERPSPPAEEFALCTAESRVRDIVSLFVDRVVRACVVVLEVGEEEAA